MAVDTAWLKAHWYYIAGGVLGLLVLYELLSSLSSGATAASGSSTLDVSGGANQLASVQASADLTDAQTNGAVEESSYAADVANNQTAAALQLGEVQTAAQLAAQNSETQASQNIDLGEASDAVEAQSLVEQGQVQETQIEGSTLDQIAATEGSTQVQLAKVAVSPTLAAISQVGTQLSNIQAYSKNAGSDYTKIAPLIGEELGEQGAAAATSATVAKGTTAPSTVAQNITAGGQAAQGISTMLAGLFA